jgi:two-component system response regulator YesN
MIADDELLVQIGLKSIVDYEKLGLQLLDIAKNGQEALNILKKEKPDIAIMDIRMPKLNGIEVIERFLTENPCKPEPLFIILTNLDNFDHARSAIRLNVFDYLIKVELNPIVFTNTLQRAIKYLDEQNRISLPPKDTNIHRIQVEKYFLKFLNAWFTDPTELAEEASELAIDFTHPKYCVLCLTQMKKIFSNRNQPNYEGSDGRGEILADYPAGRDHLRRLGYLNDLIFRICTKYYPCYVTSWNIYNSIIILGIDGPEKEEKGAIKECIMDILRTAEQFINMKLVAGIGRVTELGGVSVSFREALEACDFSDSENRLTFYDKASSDVRINDTLAIISQEGKKIINAIVNYRINEISTVFEEIKTILRREKITIKDAIAICSGILHYISVSNHKISRFLLDFLPKDSKPFYNLVFFNTIPQVLIWLDELQEDLTCKVEKDFEMNRNWIIVNVKQYIENHYNETLSQTDIAREFDVSAGYISTMFKKYNDIGFSECVAQAKIMHAKKLLIEGKLKIYEISDAVGYSDSYYFSKVFKKITGLSPKDYAAHQKSTHPAAESQGSCP